MTLNISWLIISWVVLQIFTMLGIYYILQAMKAQDRQMSCLNEMIRLNRRECLGGSDDHDDGRGHEEGRAES